MGVPFPCGSDKNQFLQKNGFGVIGKEEIHGRLCTRRSSAATVEGQHRAGGAAVTFFKLSAAREEEGLLFFRSGRGIAFTSKSSQHVSLVGRPPGRNLAVMAFS